MEWRPKEKEVFIDSKYLNGTIKTNNSVKSIVQNLKWNYWLKARYCNEEWIEWYYFKPVDYDKIIKIVGRGHIVSLTGYIINNINHGDRVYIVLI